MGSAYDKDPAFLHGPQTGFDWEHDYSAEHGAATRVPWSTRRLYASAMPASTKRLFYKLRIVYTGDMFQAKVRLVAGESLEVHPYLLETSGHEARGV